MKTLVENGYSFRTEDKCIYLTRYQQRIPNAPGLVSSEANVHRLNMVLNTQVSEIISNEAESDRVLLEALGLSRKNINDLLLPERVSA